MHLHALSVMLSLILQPNKHHQDSQMILHSTLMFSLTMIKHVI